MATKKKIEFPLDDLNANWPHEHVRGPFAGWVQTQRPTQTFDIPALPRGGTVETTVCVDFERDETRGASFAEARPQAPATPSIEIILRMLRNSERTTIAERIEYLRGICRNDDEPDLNAQSLWSLAAFFLSIDKNRSVPSISVSPHGVFVSEWIATDEATAMEFVGENEIRLVRIFGNQAEIKNLTFREAESFLR
jgi:hypothetical protein